MGGVTHAGVVLAAQISPVPVHVPIHVQLDAPVHVRPKVGVNLAEPSIDIRVGV